MKIAGVQMDVSIQNVDRNLEAMIDRLRETTAAGARLTVFPECALCGYCFGSLDEARPFAQSIPGPATETMREACAPSWVATRSLECLKLPDRIFTTRPCWSGRPE